MTQHLNTEQIEALFAFVQKKRVRHYDLQVELVDHLASSIEGLWKENPDVSFEKVLAKVYRQFGARGFREVIRKKEKALSRQAQRWTFSYILNWLRFPKVLFLILIIVSFAKILIWLPGSIAVWVFVLGQMAAIGIVGDLYMKFDLRKKSKKRFMMLEEPVIANGAILAILGTFFGNTSYFLIKLHPLSDWPFFWAYILSTYIVFCVLFIYAFSVNNRKKAIEYLNKHFPQSIA